jgi:long-chain fatty acid transport protein
MGRLLLIVSFGLILAQAASARPYPAQSGISAAADSAAVAANNPAGMTRFDSLNMRFEALGFFSDNTWEGQIGDDGPTFRSEDSSSTFVPTISLVMPLKNDWYFGFTVLGMAFSEDFGKDWPGRYFIQDYDLLYVSAFPSIARRLNDQWSVAASLALTYTRYEQSKAVPNIDDGFGDGSLTIDADGTTVGFSLSTLYEHSNQTRFGLVYRSELDAELNDNAEFSGLGPTTEAILEAAGLLGASIDITSRTPQSITAGMYHEFSDRGAFTVDVAWIDFSEFILSEIFVNGDQIVEQTVEYEDIWAVSASYSRPVSDRFTLGLGAAYVDDMISDDQRTLALRLDSVWVVGIGLGWQWTPTRAINATLNYIETGDAPITSPSIGGIGSVTGAYTDRGTIWLQASLDIGKGAH